MSESNFKPGDIVEHIYWDYPELFVVKLLDDGKVGCRYRSMHKGNSNSEYIFHYHEFEAFELKLSDEKGGLPISSLSI